MGQETSKGRQQGGIHNQAGENVPYTATSISKTNEVISIRESEALNEQDPLLEALNSLPVFKPIGSLSKEQDGLRHDSLEEVLLSFQNYLRTIGRVASRDQALLSRRVRNMEQRIAEGLCIAAFLAEDSGKHASYAREVERVQKQVISLEKLVGTVIERVDRISGLLGEKS